jgi:hypothetical protein
MCKTNGWKPIEKIFQIKLIMGECEDVGIKPCLGPKYFTLALGFTRF